MLIMAIKIFNMKAMKLLRQGGYLITCSCSRFMETALFEQMLEKIRKRMWSDSKTSISDSTECRSSNSLDYGRNILLKILYLPDYLEVFGLLF